jgi:uncharacterized protein YdhG (YjbR/CyaY superfamily)
MQYEAKTPREYLELLDKDWRREKLLELRDLITSHDTGLIEGISYKMLSYSDQRGIIFGLNAQKHYVSLYVGDAKKIDTDGSLLEGLNIGKGCIRFSKTTSVAGTNIDEFIERAIAMWKRGKDIEC